MDNSFDCVTCFGIVHHGNSGQKGHIITRIHDKSTVHEGTMMQIVPSMSAKDFEALLEALPDPATHATVFLNGYFDISDLKRQAEQIVPGIDFYNGEVIKLAMGKPSRDILRKLYRHERETDRMEVSNPEDLKPRMQLDKVMWYFTKKTR